MKRRWDAKRHVYPTIEEEHGLEKRVKTSQGDPRLPQDVGGYHIGLASNAVWLKKVIIHRSSIYHSYKILYIRNIYRYSWYKITRNTDPMGRPLKAAASVFFVSAHSFPYIMNIYGYSLYIPYTFHIYFLNMFHIFSFVCCFICGVKSRSGHDRSKSVPSSA